jgi:hypothetical protein
VKILIFLPREGEGDELSQQPEVEMISLDAVQMTIDGYEITSPGAKDLTDYNGIIEKLSEAADPEERVYLAVEWIKKRNCIVLVTSNVEGKIKNLSGTGTSAEYEKIEERLWEQSHQFITDRSEFESIADMLVGCAKGEDRFYVAFDWKKKKNVILWSTKDPSERGGCSRGRGVAPVVQT